MGTDVIEMVLSEEDIKKDQDHPERESNSHQEVDARCEKAAGFASF